MRLIHVIFTLGLVLTLNNAWGASDPLNNYKTLTML